MAEGLLRRSLPAPAGLPAGFHYIVGEFNRPTGLHHPFEDASVLMALVHVRVSSPLDAATCGCSDWQLMPLLKTIDELSVTHCKKLPDFRVCHFSDASIQDPLANARVSIVVGTIVTMWMSERQLKIVDEPVPQMFYNQTDQTTEYHEHALTTIQKLLEETGHKPEYLYCGAHLA
eukprot:2097551-Amphidinium_carterae.3